jgi:hypothetical protein
MKAELTNARPHRGCLESLTDLAGIKSPAGNRMSEDPIIIAAPFRRFRVSV